MDGALLAHTGSHYFLIGKLERPCDFRAHGFEEPAQEVDARSRPYIELKRLHAAVKLDTPNIVVPLEGEALAKLLAARLLNERTGAVSDPLWRLAIGASDESSRVPATQDAHWFTETPDRIWSIVRDSVLRAL
ncbi:MAG TPA: precorrin-3B C(17)-methyltransferase [Polyangiales bacterium]|nr:precorrin-3B C(17)-methyltransferase [Polyangiales bacterium]